MSLICQIDNRYLIAEWKVILSGLILVKLNGKLKESSQNMNSRSIAKECLIFNLGIFNSDLFVFISLTLSSKNPLNHIVHNFIKAFKIHIFQASLHQYIKRSISQNGAKYESVSDTSHRSIRKMPNKCYPLACFGDFIIRKIFFKMIKYINGIAAPSTLFLTASMIFFSRLVNLEL